MDECLGLTCFGIPDPYRAMAAGAGPLSRPVWAFTLSTWDNVYHDRRPNAGSLVRLPRRGARLYLLDLRAPARHLPGGTRGRYGGFWYLTKNEDIFAAEQDPGTFSVGPSMFVPTLALISH
jgi:hypothetical protein